MFFYNKKISDPTFFIVFFLKFLSVIFFLFSFTFANYQLKISEVYFDWSKEWLEIANVGDSEFSWNLIIKSDSTNSWYENNIKIQSGQIVIFWQNWFETNFLQTWCVLDNNLDNFDVDDDTSINSVIQIRNSWQLLDSVVISWNNKKYNTSLYRSWDLMLPVWQDDIYNVFHFIRANPCSSKLLNSTKITNWNDYLPTNQTLLISEVYFDWSKEWFEVTNLSNQDFNWTLTFAGIWWWIVSYTTSIPAKSVKVFKHSSVDYFTWNVSTQDESLYNKFTDDQRISISLFSWNYASTGNLLDLFYRTASDVNDIDWDKTSFEKILSWNDFVITPTVLSRQYNVSDLSYIVNPWVLFNSNNQIIIPEQTPIVVQSWLVKFNEIKKTDWYSPNYIEFVINTWFSGTLIVSWTAISNQLQWTNQFETWRLYLFIDWYDPNEENARSDVFSLNNWILNIFYSWVLQDSIQITDINLAKTWQSLYRNWNLFDKVWTWSPGLPESFVKLLPRLEIIKTITQEKTVYVDNWWSCSCPSCPVCPTKEELCSWFESLNVVSWNYDSWINLQSNLFSWNIIISRLLINPDWSDYWKEEIWLTLLSGKMLSLSWFSLLYSDWKKYKFQTWDFVFSWCESVFTWVPSLVNSKNLCVSLKFNTKIIDTLCYTKNTKEKIKKNIKKCNFQNIIFSWNLLTWSLNITWNNLSWNLIYDTWFFYDFTWDLDNNVKTWEIFDYRKFDILITNLIYNPKLQWWTWESITIFFDKWTGFIDLSNLKLRINNNKTIKSLWNWKIKPGQKLTIFKNFWFPNTKDSIIHLLYKSWNSFYEYDTFSYKILNKDKLDKQKDESRKNREIRIKNIIYDPPWNDRWNEQISLKLIKWDTVDLKYLYLDINWRKKKLNWMLYPNQIKVLKWYFWFSNTKTTCVKLMREDFVFDSMCYSPKKNKPLKENLEKNDKNFTWQNFTWEISFEDKLSNIQLKIENIIYNPPWNDKWNEQIVLFYKKWKYDLNLSDWFYLKIWDKFKSLKYFGIIKPWNKYNLKWYFAFPNNKSTCVDLINKKTKQVFDKYCYIPQNQKSKNKTLKEQKNAGSDIFDNIKLIKKAKLTKVWKKICLNYKWQIIKCRYAPNIKQKITLTKSDQQKLLENYVRLIEQELRQNWTDLWYNTKLNRYYTLYKRSLILLKRWIKTIKINWVEVSVFDLQTQYNLIYWQQAEQYFANYFENLIKTNLSIGNKKF